MSWNENQVLLAFSLKEEFFKKLKIEEKMKIILIADEMFSWCQAVCGWRKNNLDLTRNSKYGAFPTW